ncbi:RNA-directed DNA polymerase, eukaryota [Tanacetum coccineum]
MEDRWTWNLSSSGEFSVSSVRCLIDDKTLPVFDHQTRWVRFVPIKVNVIAWKVKNNSLPTRFNISRRGISINCIKCAICDIGVETVNHLFFSCELVTQLVKMIVRWWSVPYLEIDSYADWVSWMDNLHLPIKNKLMLEGVFYVMWILWVEIEGVPFKLWSKNTFKKIASKWGEILDTEDQEEDGFYTKRLCIYSKLGNNIYENFKVIFRGKVFVLRAKEIPGWVPEFADEFDDDDESEEGSKGDTANSHGAFNFDDADDVDKVPETELDDPLEQNNPR